jgi:Protein of unknown function (DUF1353)
MSASTRRDFLKAIGALGLGLGSPLSCSASANAEERYAADGDTISRWMDEWIKLDRKPSGPLHVGRFADPIYFLLTPIRWEPNPGQNAYEPVTVPVGFVTDFASIPRAFWSILRPDGLYTYPAIVHDYLYWTQMRPRDTADNILKFGMEDFSVGAATIAAIYNAVHLFGEAPWNENGRLKGAGEKRILRRFPDDPRITWEEWKKLPDAFEAP